MKWPFRPSLTFYVFFVTFQGLSPLATSPLVRQCLKALRVYLPRDASLHFVCQWYSCRNTIGSENLSPSQEWEQFVKCLLKQCGYHIDTLNVFEFSMRVSGGCSPEAGAKKVRPNEHGSDDDWQLLLVSSIRPSRARLLKLGYTKRWYKFIRPLTAKF